MVAKKKSARNAAKSKANLKIESNSKLKQSTLKFKPSKPTTNNHKEDEKVKDNQVCNSTVVQSDHPRCFIHRLREAMDVRNGVFSWSQDGSKILINKTKYGEIVNKKHPGLISNTSFANLKRQLKVYLFETVESDKSYIESFSNKLFTRQFTDLAELLRIKSDFIKQQRIRIDEQTKANQSKLTEKVKKLEEKVEPSVRSIKVKPIETIISKTSKIEKVEKNAIEVRVTRKRSTTSEKVKKLEEKVEPSVKSIKDTTPVPCIKKTHNANESNKKLKLESLIQTIHVNRKQMPDTIETVINERRKTRNSIRQSSKSDLNNTADAPSITKNQEPPISRLQIAPITSIKVSDIKEPVKTIQDKSKQENTPFLKSSGVNCIKENIVPASPVKKFIVKAPKVRAIRDVEIEEMICKPSKVARLSEVHTGYPKPPEDLESNSDDHCESKARLELLSPVQRRKLRSVHFKPARFMSPADEKKMHSKPSICVTRDQELSAQDKKSFANESARPMPGKSSLKNINSLTNKEKVKRVLTFKSPLANYQMIPHQEGEHSNDNEGDELEGGQPDNHVSTCDDSDLDLDFDLDTPSARRTGNPRRAAAVSSRSSTQSVLDSILDDEDDYPSDEDKDNDEDYELDESEEEEMDEDLPEMDESEEIVTQKKNNVGMANYMRKKAIQLNQIKFYNRVIQEIDNRDEMIRGKAYFQQVVPDYVIKYVPTRTYNNLGQPMYKAWWERLPQPLKKQDWYLNCLPFMPKHETTPPSSLAPNDCCIKAGVNTSSRALFYCNQMNVITDPVLYMDQCNNRPK